MAKYIVTWVDRITPTILGLSLQRKSGKPLQFLPGQYATISYYKNHRPSAARCFSIASSPALPDRLEFGVRIAGKYTTALTTLTPGDIVTIDGPYGSFVFDSTTQQKIVMCAGGIGITPFMSMMRYASQLHLTNDLSLVFSVRDQNDIPYFEEIKHLSTTNPHLKVAFVVASGDTNLIPSEHQVFTGRISPEVLHEVTGGDFREPSFFICGPPPFMKGTSVILASNGVSKDRIITEAFSQGSHKQTGRSRGWPFNIYVMGAVGALASSVVVMSTDMAKSLPPMLLPTTLTNDQTAFNGRAQDLDTLVNNLQAIVAQNAKSPSVIAAEKDVADAQAKADEVNKQNAAITGGTYVASSSSSSSSSSSASATPTPVPVHVPVCTTSSKGVKTCI
jgi:ferredoxin-NADP reductase